MIVSFAANIDTVAPAGQALRQQIAVSVAEWVVAAPKKGDVWGGAGRAAPQDEDTVSTPERFKSDLIAMLPRLRRFAMTLTRSAADADDLVQDACATALLKWSYYDPSQPLDRWVFRILRNQWISETRKRKVRVGQGQVPAEESPELVARDSSDTTLLAQQVVAHVGMLPAELSEPLMLVCAEGYSYREVAELLDTPIGTVMSRIHRARKELSARLQPAAGGAA